MATPSQTAPATASVRELQQVLTNYAKATGFVAANPGPIDGKVGIRTVMAVAAIVPHIPKLPSSVRVLATLAPLAIAIDSARAEAIKIITQNASSISKAIVAVAAYQAYTGKVPTGTQPPAGGQMPVLPVGPTAPSGAVPSGSIYYYDARKRYYRIAVPRGLMGLGASYSEVSPSMNPPAGGMQVTKTDFLVQTGQWYATPWGIAGIVGGSGVLIGGVALLVRAVAR